MKIKIIPAYESESSNTLRLTPKQIAILLDKCNLDTLQKVLEEYIDITTIYKPKTIIKRRVDMFKEVICQSTLP